DLLRRADVEADRERVDAGEVLEQERLALHDRQRRLGPDATEAQHRRAVGDDGDGVLLDRQVVDALRVLGDGLADPGHARRVGHRQVVAVADRHAGQHLDLAAVVHEEGAVEHLEHLAALEALRGGPHLLDVGLVAAVDDQVLLEHRPPYVEAPDRGDVATGVTDRRGEAAQRARPVVQPDPGTDRVRRWRGSHGRDVAATPHLGSNGAPASPAGCPAGPGDGSSTQLSGMPRTERSRDAAPHGNRCPVVRPSPRFVAVVRAPDAPAGRKYPRGVAGVFDIVASDEFEQVSYFHDAATGLRAIVAIHSTALGPALGGTRFYPYATEEEALVDVCRLARAMTYKHAACGNDLGGGKAVIIGDPATLRSEALFRAYGRFVEGLNGRYITAEDVGTTQADMDLVRRETRHVTGVSESLGGSGDPSPATAWGVLWAMKAVAERLWGSPSLAGRHVCISGVGKVGATLAHHLAEEGAKLTVADVRPDAVDAMVERHGAVPVAPEQAHTVPCDIFAPCALGGVLDATTVPELRCDAVVGSANNQLATPADAERLRHRGTVYAPDFVANAGGVINIAEEPHGYDRQRAYDRIRSIYDTLLAVFDRADAEGITTAEAAD